GGDLRVLVALRPLGHLTGDLDAELRAQPVRALGHLAFPEHDLRHPGRVAQVDEDDAAVITPPGHPTGQRDGLAGVLGTQGAGFVGAEHEYRCLSVRRSSPKTARLTNAAEPPATGFVSAGPIAAGILPPDRQRCRTCE